MPTKNNRYYVSLPPDLEEFLVKEAELEMRPVATHITWICQQYRRRRMDQLELLNHHQGSRAVRDERLVYDTPPPKADAPSKARGNAH